MHEGLPEGTLTLLFTDVEGSTDLTTRLGDEAAQRILRSHRQLVQRQVEQFGGQQIKGTGDGSMVAFSSARRAVECAIAIQRAVRTRNEGYPHEAIPVRIGINSGEVIREEGPDGRGDLFGATVTAAARIAAKASGDEILVAETVKGLLGAVKDLQFADRGRFRLKGFADRWHLYQVLWEREGDVSGPVLLRRTPGVGRERPLLLVIEDLHWADDSTLLLLQHLAQRANGMRVLVIGTYRDIELEGHYPLQRALEVLVSQRLAEQISLDCLAPAAVEAMLRALAGRPLPQQLFQLIMSETEGNPFFIEEVFKYLLEEKK